MKPFLQGMVLLLLVSRQLSAQGPYSAGLNDPENPHDAPLPGFVGPHGAGAARLYNPVTQTWSNPDNIVNPLFFGWANQVVDYRHSEDPKLEETWTDDTRALGPVTGNFVDVVSLGELSAEQIADSDPPGHITLGFPAPIRNRSGADFVVFENGFGSQGQVFAELAFVEVSSNGVDFARFPSHSLTPGPVGPYDYLDPRNVSGLAGKHVNAGGQSWGTPFDLAALSEDPLVEDGTVDLNAITHVRIVDVPGNGSFTDSDGNPIYDPWPTWGSGGFDLEAVGVISRDMSYETWAEQLISDPEARGGSDDASGDGVPNVFAYALGRAPTLPDPSPVSSPVVEDGRLLLRFTRDERAVDLVYEVQTSTDLTDWSTIARGAGGQPLEGVEGHAPLIEETSAHPIHSVGVIREVRVGGVPSESGVRFLRLKVSRSVP